MRSPETGDSPFAPAPPFRDVAKNYTQDELVDGFMEGPAVRHQAMPDWDMTIDQAEAIATNIMGLKRTGRPSVDPELILRMLVIAYCYGIR